MGTPVECCGCGVCAHVLSMSVPRQVPLALRYENRTTTTYKDRSVPFCSAPYSRAPFANRTQSSNIPRLNLRRLNLLRAFLAPFDMQHTSLSPHSSSSTRMLSRRCAISRAITAANAACTDCGMPSFAFCPCSFTFDTSPRCGVRDSDTRQAGRGMQPTRHLS